MAAVTIELLLISALVTVWFGNILDKLKYIALTPVSGCG